MRRRLVGVLIVLALAWGGLAASLAFGITPELGLDLEGGTSVVLTAPSDTDPEVLELAVDIMRRRIEDVGGVQEPEIAISGGNTVLVQLPGVEDPERALEAIGRTGRLSFRPVLGATPGDTGPLVTTTTTTTAPEGQATTTTTAPATTTTAGTTNTTLPPGIDPDTGLTIDDDPGEEAYLLYDAGLFGPQVLHVGPSELDGADIAEAIPGFDPSQGQWVVSLGLTDEGGREFAELTAQAAEFPAGDPRRQIAIVLDGEVISAPQVDPTVSPDEGITGGRAVITLGASPEAEAEAGDLATILRYGSLPVSFERSQVERVSATLGTDSLRIGIASGLAGLALVALALLFYYRALGLVAVVGLTVFGTLLVTVFSLLGRFQGVTLTLAGVTGIIVSVGITADSYIVYFERIKDEIRNGKTVRAAVHDGFGDAFRTILTADTVSLLGAGLLYYLAVGPVKGFALSLGIATLLDLFIARAYTRRAAWLVAHTGLGERGGFSVAAAAGEAAPA